jgi:DNA-binding NarL/FixJ family response regulator
VRAGGVHLSAELAERVLVDRGHGVQIAQHATLSGREFEVLRRLTRGESPPAIATALVLAASVVTTSCQRIMAKLGLSNLAELVRYGVDNGLGALRPPPGSPPPPQPCSTPRTSVPMGLMPR